ncbi:RagB/SusD family nutrient uptake outer membrane protein [Olivibacter domesticus]|uniref:Starch-binding associating with outer membrane n=1 Tax=Olivibacter domesticus TaxID=407022 RepID=A0A1H7WUP1_OLID1|nr:RagB/SusD family nutrient uptake outer membrane protein [Olivibacter domesticus]SEM25223.1 Starch-binding associating with outer membrane [Olivibacter domesticus]
MKTQLKKYLILTFVACMSLSSCKKYLDKLPDDQLTEEQVFTRYDKVNQLVTDLYAKAKTANAPMTWFADFSTAGITDEAEATNVGNNAANSFNTGDWNTTNIPGSRGQYWNDLYAGIRKANVILVGVEKYQTPDNPINPGDLQKRVGETYFMRAYLHYLVLRIYGEAPYLDYVVDVNQSKDFTRESAQAVGDKIVQDAQEAFNRLPADWSSNDFGRVDKGACLGLIAITRWTQAAPLWNGASQYGYTGNRVFENDYAYNAARWAAARDAAKAVLDLKNEAGSPRFSLYQKYSDQDFNDSGNQNTSGSTVYTRLWQMYYDMDAFKTEAVWFVTKDKYEGWYGDVYPPSRGGSSRQQPVQEQVDEYEYMAPDGYGYPVYADRAKNDGYDDGNPYRSVKRDPRFYRDIVYHGAPFRNGTNNPSTVNTASGADKINASNATKTGYYLRKYLQEAWNKNGSLRISAPPIWRLPDFIYIYAEAVNELDGPNAEIYNLINQVRARSFMVPMPPETMNNRELMREYIKRERRVEFFYENKRAFDARLYLEPTSDSEVNKEQQFRSAGGSNNERSQQYWTKGYGSYPKTQRMINGMQPVEDPNGKIEIDGKKYRMERFFVEDRVFTAPKHYLFPLMNTELQQSPTLVQNPGW